MTPIMSLTDRCIQAALEGDHYTVTDAGAVYGRYGRRLVCPPDDDGYRRVALRTSVGGASALVHRLVAAQAWGIDAITGRQVGHINGVRDDNRLENLWLPASAREHNEFDGTVQNLKIGQAWMKTSWPACAECGNPDGPLPHGRVRVTPERITGRRFGIDGQLCRPCYQRLQQAQDRMRRAA